MKTISNNALKLISGGIANKSSEGILVTDGSNMVIQGMQFNSNGTLFNTFTSKVLHDFTVNTNPYCIFGHQISATTVEGGYLYKTGTCTN